MLSICVYIVTRNIFVGNDLYSKDKNIPHIINSIIMGITVTFTLVFLRYKEFNTINDFILDSIITFICAFVSSFLVYFIINKITQKRVKYIENKYDEE